MRERWKLNGFLSSGLWYDVCMSSELNRISSWSFYALGTSFFLGYLLLRNGVATPWPQWWLSVMDLPLLLSGMAYGGTSLYLSVKMPKDPAPVLAWSIVVPLVTLFVLLASLNYAV